MGNNSTLEYALGSEYQATEAQEGHRQERQEVRDHPICGVVCEVCGVKAEESLQDGGRFGLYYGNVLSWSEQSEMEDPESPS